MKKLKRLFLNKSVIKNLHSQKIFGFAAVSAGLATLSQQTQAQTVIGDNFSTSSQYGNILNGISPGQTNLPGGTYLLVGSGNDDSYEYSNTTFAPIGTVQDYAREHNGGAIGVSLGSYGTAGGAPLTFSAAVAPNPVGSGNLSGYDVLGVGSTATASNYSGPGFADTIGLNLDQSGNLSYMIAGALTSTGIAAGIGIFDPNGFTTLSYQLAFNADDTATFSNIVLDGTSYSNTYTTGTLASDAFSYAEFGGGTSASGGSQATAVTNFSVTAAAAVPEPSSYALLAGGALALGVYQYRRRQQLGI